MTKDEARQIINEFIDQFESDDEFDYYYNCMIEPLGRLVTQSAVNHELQQQIGDND